VAAAVSRGRGGGGAGGGGSTGLRAEHGGAGAARCGAGGSAGLRAERGGAGAARSVLTAASMAGSRGVLQRGVPTLLVSAELCWRLGLLSWAARDRPVAPSCV